MAVSRHCFLVVCRRKSDSLAAKVLFKELAMRHIEGHIEKHFGLSRTLGANARIFLDQSVDILVKLIGHDEVVDKPDFIGAPAIDILA